MYFDDLKLGMSVEIDRAWKAAGFSSHTEDYYSVEDAVLVDWINE